MSGTTQSKATAAWFCYLKKAHRQIGPNAQRPQRGCF